VTFRQLEIKSTQGMRNYWGDIVAQINLTHPATSLNLIVDINEAGLNLKIVSDIMRQYSTSPEGTHINRNLPIQVALRAYSASPCDVASIVEKLATNHSFFVVGHPIQTLGVVDVLMVRADILGFNLADASVTFGYNVGDHMNLPSFVAQEWPPEGSRGIRALAMNTAAQRPQSLVGHYARAELSGACVSLHDATKLNKVQCKFFPDVLLLRSSAARMAAVPCTMTTVWGCASKGRIAAQDNNTLVIHFRSGDSPSHPDDFRRFTSVVAKLAKSFSRTIILGGIHADFRYYSLEASVAGSQAEYELLSAAIQEAGSQVTLQLDSAADEDMLVMYHARHLLVHRGGFSALGALLCQGTVYYTDMLAHPNKSVRFRNMMRSPRYMTFIPDTRDTPS